MFNNPSGNQTGYHETFHILWNSFALGTELSFRTSGDKLQVSCYENII